MLTVTCRLTACTPGSAPGPALDNVYGRTLPYHLLLSPGMTQPSSAQTNAPVAEAIDDCGLRFLLASRHHVYLLNTLPLRQRAQMQQMGLSPAYYVWAFHSESQDELLNSLPSMQKGAPTWAEMRQFGVGWWLRNINSLQRCAEKVTV